MEPLAEGSTAERPELIPRIATVLGFAPLKLLLVGACGLGNSPRCCRFNFTLTPASSSRAATSTNCYAAGAAGVDVPARGFAFRFEGGQASSSLGPSRKPFVRCRDNPAGTVRPVALLSWARQCCVGRATAAVLALAVPRYTTSSFAASLAFVVVALGQDKVLRSSKRNLPDVRICLRKTRYTSDGSSF